MPLRLGSASLQRCRVIAERTGDSSSGMSAMSHSLPIRTLPGRIRSEIFEKRNKADQVGQGKTPYSIARHRLLIFFSNE